MLKKDSTNFSVIKLYDSDREPTSSKVVDSSFPSFTLQHPLCLGLCSNDELYYATFHCILNWKFPRVKIDSDVFNVHIEEKLVVEPPFAVSETNYTMYKYKKVIEGGSIQWKLISGTVKDSNNNPVVLTDSGELSYYVEGEIEYGYVVMAKLPLSYSVFLKEVKEE